MSPWRSYVTIGLGSALGGLARYGCGVGMAALVGPGFPWGTLLVNVVGCFVIGFFATLTAPEGRLLVGTLARQFVMVGICGGYTTFSSFSLDTVELLRAGARAAAAANIAASMTLCLLTVWFGHRLAATLNK